MIEVVGNMCTMEHQWNTYTDK